MYCIALLGRNLDNLLFGGYDEFLNEGGLD